jgi:chromate reductase
VFGPVASACDGPSVAGMKILAISGSLRAGSYNTAMLRAAQRVAPDGMRVELYGRLRDIPPYDMDLDTPYQRPEPVADLRRRIEEADGLLIATPEFNYCVPGVLKNAIDWASTDWTRSEGLPLHRKPAAIMGAAPTDFGSVRAQLSLRRMFVWTDTDVVVKPELIAFRAHERFDADGNADPATAGLIRDLLAALAGKIERARTAAAA